jgi:putative peptidoglycan lipid II flippase
MSAAVAASRVTGLVREIVLARLFGASMDFDAFRLGFQLPNLTRDLFAEGALSSAFVPLFTDYLTNRGREEAQRLANLVMTAVLIVIGAICVAGVAFAPQLVDLFASGFSLVPGKRELAIELTRISFPSCCWWRSPHSMGILSVQPIWSSALTRRCSISVRFVLACWESRSARGSDSRALKNGVGSGAGRRTAIFLADSFGPAAGFRLRPRFDPSDPGLRQIRG